MFLFRHGGRQALRASVQATRTSREYASKIDIPFASTPFPVIDSCPAPTCQCRDSLAGLEIEREANLNGSMASYGEQVLISTGRDDWKSRIEEDEDAVLVRQLKQHLLKGGKYMDPYHNVMITNSSFSPTPSQHTSVPSTASAFLLPSFQYVPSIPTSANAVEAFIKAFILPTKLHAQHDRLPSTEKDKLLRTPERQTEFRGARPIDEILVLICGHGGRDERCGKLGPILRDEFEEKLGRRDVEVLRDAPAAEAEGRDADGQRSVPAARVGLISHIGGHKWAGNVIVYIPPRYSGNQLAGKGVWYGRVGPEHVEGIVEETILGGKVIKDLFRGGIDRSGEVLRL